MTERLAEDHLNARRLAESLALVDGFEVDMLTVQTNIVAVNLNDKTYSAVDWISKLKQNGVLCGKVGPRRLRFVMHNDVGRREVEQALAVIASLAG